MPTERRHTPPAWIVVAATGAITGVWAVVGLWVPAVRVEAASPTLRAGIDAAGVSAGLFAVLILALFPGRDVQERLRWVGAGFAVTSIAAPMLDLLVPLVATSRPSGGLFWLPWTMALVGGACFWVGLASSRPPLLTTPRARVIVGSLCIAAAVLLLNRHQLPDLAYAAGTSAAMSDANGVYVVVAMVPLGFTVAAAIGAGLRSRAIPLDGWLIGSLTLLAGAQVHDICWPASYGQAVANSDLVRLASTGLLALGGVLALRRVAAERAHHLATERANVARLHDVATRTTDHIAMIVHELGSPIAAIRAYTEILTPSELDTETRHRAIGAIQAETRLLDTLVGDARLMTAVERDEFAVFPFPIRADLLLADAGAFARTLPGHHPFAYAGGVYDRILADPDRLGQVLRNLILNATKHTPPGTPIELRARRAGDRLLIDVADQGPGIAPEDQERIFEKFQRGSGELPPGLGLGLYVSRRLVEAHGGSLTVVSRPGRGTVFTVELGVVG